MKLLPAVLGLVLTATFAGCGAPGEAPDLAQAQAALTGPEYGFALHNGYSSGFCLDVVGQNTADNAGLQAWYCNGLLNQAFISVLPDGTSRPPVPGDEIKLMARHSDKCLDDPGASLLPDTAMIQWPCHDGANQKWTVIDAGNSMFLLANKASGLCLSAETPMAGAPIRQYGCNPSDAKQKWSFAQTNVPPRPPAGTTVWLYEHVNYQGGYMTLTSDIPNLNLWTWANWDNVTSSIKVSAGGFVTIYRDPDYQGPCETIWFDAPDMYQRLVGNDAVSSVRMGSYCATAVLYEHGDYGGTAKSRSETDNLASVGFDEITSSIRVSPGMTLSGYSSAYYQGSCSAFSGDVSSMSGTLVGNDRLSSFQFGNRCITRQVTLQNNAAMTVRFRLKRDGAWSDYSSNIDAGQSRTISFTEGAPLEVSVEYFDIGGWATGEAFCEQTLDSSSSRTVKVVGVTLSHGCFVE